MQRRAFFLSVVLLFVGVFSKFAFAGETGHYVPGSEGLRAGTIPPPGFYYRNYATFYWADEVKDSIGVTKNQHFKVVIFSDVHRFVWVFKDALFGGDYFCDIVMPLVYTDFESGPAKFNDFGLGDINIEPLGIAWHGQRYDLAIGLSVYVPTGQYSEANPASPGKDFWTQMSTLGGTYYFDDAKTLAASILCRYEIHSKKDHTDVKPARNFLFEWGLSKIINQTLEAGVTGYCLWQLGRDHGSDVTWDKGVKDRVYAIGPEVIYSNQKKDLFLSVRYLTEFAAVDRGEGDLVTMTLTKRF